MATEPANLRHIPLRQAVIAIATAGFLSAFTGVAGASPNFPDVLQKVAGSDCAPSCLLCHSTNPGRKGTAVQSGKPFTNAVLMKGHLLGGENDATARAAFLKMKNGDPAAMPPVAPSDVDMPPDGTSDFQDLGLNINPNPGKADLCEVAYGCGARIAPTPPPSRLAVFSSLLVAVGLLVMGARARSGRR